VGADASSKREQKALEDLVREKSEKGAAIYFLSEVGYDAEYFADDEESQQAYQNALKFMAQDGPISGIVVDGALTRLDRPEVLSAALTYWVSSEEECRKATEEIKNSEHYEYMMDHHMRTLEERLGELKAKVPNAKEIVYHLPSDDLQFTASKMLNALLFKKRKDIEGSISGERQALKEKRNEITTYQKSIKSYEGEIRKLEKKGEKKGEAAYDGKIGNLKENISTLKEKIRTRNQTIDRIKGRIAEHSDEKKLYREQKIRPIHQLVTREYIQDIYGRTEAICKKLGVTFTKTNFVKTFDGITIDYGHNRHFSQAVVKRRDKALLESTHGKIAKYQEDVARDMKDKSFKGVDWIVESGHHGIDYSQTQRTTDHPAGTNFENQSEYDPVTSEKHIRLLLVRPFENQRAIAKYTSGHRSIRMAGGKPVNTRNNAAFDRKKNDSVTGLTIIRRLANGIEGEETIDYDLFIEKEIGGRKSPLAPALILPDQFDIGFVTSDEHIGSPEENPMAQDGAIELYKRLAEELIPFRMKAAFARSYISGGDTAEANSRSWNHRYHFKRSPQKVLMENVNLLSNIDPNDKEQIYNLAMKMTNDSLGGSVENMAVVMRRVADFYMSFLEITLKQSKKKHAHVSVPGNHADGVLRDLGMREADFFRERLHGKGMTTYQVGEPGYLKDLAATRVFLGGYSNARIIQIENYGVNKKGGTREGQESINLLVQHDPKGGGMNGMVGAGKSSGADLVISGHTHEIIKRAYSIGPNRSSIAQRVGTLQDISPTEKYYAGGLNRTSAAHIFINPKPGHYFNAAITTPQLQQYGREALERRIQEELVAARVKS